ncbi:MAG: phosphoadenylyl-sulfate reductase [Actinomycetota bacterium]
MTPTPLPLPSPRRPVDTASLARDLEGRPPDEIIRRAIDVTGGDLVLLASFADVVLLDLAVTVAPDLPVVFLDTGFHFAETLETVRRAQARLGLDLRVERPSPDAPDLWAVGTTACCAARKVAPMERALRGRAGWLSGLRRADHAGREQVDVVERDRRGLLKFNPIAAWSDDDVEAYASERDLIIHPLRLEGYGSIGCWPCTTPGAGRDGRWAGQARTECGIHS